MRIVDIRNAHYLVSGLIECEVLFSGWADYLPYTPMETDTAETGRQVWQELQSGKWGEIAPYEPTQEDTETLRAGKLAEISAWRDAQENTEFTFEYDGHRWDCGKVSRGRLAPVTEVARSGLLPEGFFWTDADNNNVSLSAEALVKFEAAMVQAMVVRGFSIHERQRQMKGEVAKLESQAAILAYTIGWPEVQDE